MKVSWEFQHELEVKKLLRVISLEIDKEIHPFVEEWNTREGTILEEEYVKNH